MLFFFSNGNSLPSRPVPFVSRLAIWECFSSVNIRNQIIGCMCCLILIGKGRSRTRQVQSAARHRVWIGINKHIDVRGSGRKTFSEETLLRRFALIVAPGALTVGERGSTRSIVPNLSLMMDLCQGLVSLTGSSNENVDLDKKRKVQATTSKTIIYTE